MDHEDSIFGWERHQSHYWSLHGFIWVTKSAGDWMWRMAGMAEFAPLLCKGARGDLSPMRAQIAAMERATNRMERLSRNEDGMGALDDAWNSPEGMLPLAKMRLTQKPGERAPSKEWCTRERYPEVYCLGQPLSVRVFVRRGGGWEYKPPGAGKWTTFLGGAFDLRVALISAEALLMDESGRTAAEGERDEAIKDKSALSRGLIDARDLLRTAEAELNEARVMLIEHEYCGQEQMEGGGFAPCCPECGKQPGRPKDEHTADNCAWAKAQGEVIRAAK